MPIINDFFFEFDPRNRWDYFTSDRIPSPAPIGSYVDSLEALVQALRKAQEAQQAKDKAAQAPVEPKPQAPKFDAEQLSLRKSAEDKPIAPGDVVQLKSGGPSMTVQGAVSRDPREQEGKTSRKLDVIWFANGEVRRGEFLESTLVKTNKIG